MGEGNFTLTAYKLEEYFSIVVSHLLLINLKT